MESLLPFPAWGAENVSPLFPHFYPVILNSFPNKLSYKKKSKIQQEFLRIFCWEYWSKGDELGLSFLRKSLLRMELLLVGGMRFQATKVRGLGNLKNIPSWLGVTLLWPVCLFLRKGFKGKQSFQTNFKHWKIGSKFKVYQR
jgi:hypothetical protein